MFKMFSISIVIAAMTLGMSGCQSTYYSAMEKVGYEKRDLLKSRVKASKSAQKDAQEEFESAYEAFASLVNFEGGDLEKRYNLLKSRYESALESSEEVVERRKKIERVGSDLFKEWRKEIQLYTDAQLKSQSQRQLNATEQQFKGLVSQLKKAEKKMKPVLDPFRDRVLFLKHNLNAQSVNALKGESVKIQKDVKRLIKDMNIAIREADSFIETMGK